MKDINKDQLNKLFDLAGISIPNEITSEVISQALLEIEKKLLPSSSIKSEIELEYVPNILVVDDLELSIQHLSLLLTKSGYNVHIARSFDEAMHQFSKRNYDYILVDLFLPEPEDGLELIETLATSEKSEKDGTKIIVISGTDNKSLINECFIRGAGEFIEKSSDWHDKILKYIRKLDKNSGLKSEIITNFKDESQQIVMITVNSLNKPSLIQELEKEIILLSNSNHYNIIINMKNVIEIDSAGIGVLILGYKTCTLKKGSLNCAMLIPLLKKHYPMYI